MGSSDSIAKGSSGSIAKGSSGSIAKGSMAGCVMDWRSRVSRERTWMGASETAFSLISAIMV